MRIAFLVERPTQFEAPFYRFAARDSEHELRVLFTGGPGVENPVFDPELGTSVSWGIDLLGGYSWELCPRQGAKRWLAERLNSERCDLLIVNGYTQPVYRLGARLARHAGVATALRLDSVRFAGSAARDLAKRLLFTLYLKRSFDLFFGAGTLTLDYLRFFQVPEERTGLFPYAVDVEDFTRRSLVPAEERAAIRSRLGVPAGARVILSLAKLSPREAPWDLLRAFSGMAAEADGLWLVLAGDGPDRAALTREAGPRTVFPGYIPYPELPALYAAADLFIHPAREERWGVSVQEALACGLPVVTSSRVGASRDLIVSGRNGFTYRAGDDAELAQRISQALLLPPEEVRRFNQSLLLRWDYAASWQGIIRRARSILH